MHPLTDPLIEIQLASHYNYKSKFHYYKIQSTIIIYHYSLNYVQMVTFHPQCHIINIGSSLNSSTKLIIV